MDDILNKFTVEGLFDAQHKDLLKPFLTEESRTHLDEILAKAEHASFVEYILTRVVMLILQERFPDFKGEWELIIKKTRKAINPIKAKASDVLTKDIESIKCAEGEV